MSAAEPLPESNVKPIAVRRPRAVAPVTPTPLDIVNAALATGNVEMYREAVALMKEMDAFAARKAFNNALADAAAQLPIITRDALVAYDRKSGGETRYQHETLANVVETIAPILAEHGLKHRWRLDHKPGGPVNVTCIISHRDGYCEENPLSAAPDNSDGKNPIQAVKSAVSYLERITLMASLGLASKGDDDDGRSTHATTAPAEYTPPPGSISQAQADELRDALEAKGINTRSFLAWAGAQIGKIIERLEDIPETMFLACKAAIKKHQGGQK